MIRKTGHRFSLGTNANRLPADHAQTNRSCSNKKTTLEAVFRLPLARPNVNYGEQPSAGRYEGDCSNIFPGKPTINVNDMAQHGGRHDCRKEDAKHVPHSKAGWVHLGNTYFQSESPGGALASRDATPDFVLPIAPRLVVFKVSAMMETDQFSSGSATRILTIEAVAALAGGRSSAATIRD
jgi:hypothetical protein